MGWIIEIGSGEWPASSAAIGVGMCVFLAWCRISTLGRKEGTEILALSGVAGVGAFVVGFLAAWSMGESGLSSLGALAGAGLVLLLLPMPPLLNRWRALDHLVPAGIAGLSVARLGCLFEGCDFGRVTDADWGVVHQTSSRAWDAHVVLHQLSPLQETSLAVHPFALYLATWGLVAAFVGEWWRRKSNAAGEGGLGQAATLSAAIFFAGGSAIELFREPAMVQQIGDGISVYPILYLMAALGALMMWRRLGRQEGVNP